MDSEFQFDILRTHLLLLLGWQKDQQLLCPITVRLLEQIFFVSEATLSIFQSIEAALAEQAECTKIMKRSAGVMLKAQ